MSPFGLSLLFSAVFMPVGAMVGALAYGRVRRIRSLLADGAQARGVVTRLEAREMSGPSESGGVTFRSYGTTVYHPVVSWTTEAGRPMETRNMIGRPLHRTPPVGTEVTVFYDQAKPSRWTMASEGTAIPRVCVAVGAVFLAVGTGFLLGGVLRVF
ncbi:DUF3592 domain-containing protein [Streptomyces sp. NPDC006992]|uniref:DUF3592 domain-containing protein n=1 Tax=Streptomyces sp. NPDC006992 TaxID=3155601 RepID=UPI0033D54E4F